MATNTVNYINPASIMPKNNWAPGGLLGGYLHMQQQGEFEKMLALEQIAQQLGVQRQQMETADFAKDQPLRDLTRQGKLAAGQAELPFLGELARSRAQTDTAKNDYERSTTYSPENVKHFFTKMKKEASDAEWKTVQNEQSMTADLVTKALEIEKTQGVLAAEQYVRSSTQQLQQRGINIPQEILTPQNWKPLQQAAVLNVETMRDMEKQGQKERHADSRKAAELNASMRNTDVLAGARVEASSNTGNRPPTATNEAPAIRAQIEALKRSGQPVPPELMERGRVAFSNEFRANIFKQDPMLALRIQQPNEQGRQAQQQYITALEQYLEANGVGRSSYQPNPAVRPTPQQGGQGGLPAPVMGGQPPQQRRPLGEIFK